MTLAIALVVSAAGCGGSERRGPAENLPVVRAVLFWSDGCPHCHEVMETHLPPLEAQYGDQLQIKTVNISDAANYRLWVQAVEAFQVPPSQQGVPMLFIGDTVLVGSLEIPEELPGLIEQHLAGGGVDWPAISGIESTQ
jgi:glutaredoxin